MRRVVFFSLFVAFIFSLLSCQIEDASSSVSISVLYPVESSFHGYQNSDLSFCKVELYGNDGASHVYSASFDSPVNIASLKKADFVARAYGYDSFGSSIAISKIIPVQLDGDTKSIQLDWFESGKTEDEICYINFDTDGGTAIKQQKVKAGDVLELPETPRKSYYTFKGWYWNFARTFEFDFGEPVSCNLTLHALWGDYNPESYDPENPDNPNNPQNPEEPLDLSEFYVSESGSDDGSGTETSPFAKVASAISAIKSKNDSSRDYKIWVSGTVRENILISDLSASSIIISGVNGAASDSLNGDLDGDGNGEDTVLTVQTAVPLTIKNLKITGGQANGGGGLFVGTSASVSLSDGSEISGNKSTSDGGGIYISGGGRLSMTGGTVSGNTAVQSGGGVYNLGSIFMSGNAVIGDKNAIQAASASDNSNSCGASNHGGGICTKGDVYIGYKDESTPDTSFTGGVFFNYSAHHGGGIYSSGDGNVIKIASGSVAYNGTYSDGGGIRLAGSGDSLELSDGNITGNKSNLTSGIGGGGIYIGGTSSVTITGGQISGNSCASPGYMGNGIFANTLSSLKLGDDAKIDSSNDVYLKSIAIELISGLSNTSVATITPETYMAGVTVLIGGSLVGSNYGKFEVSVPADNTTWGIDSTGQLKLSIETKLYVAPSGSDADGVSGLSDTSPVASLGRAVTLLKQYTSADTELAARAWTIYLSASFPASPSTTIEIDSTSAASLTICGKNGKSTDVIGGSSDFAIILKNSIPVTVENFSIRNCAGAISAEGSAKVTVSGMLINGNTDSGVKISGTGETEITDTTISGNSASKGAGIYKAGSAKLSLTNSTISDNEATADGGGLYIDGGNVEMSGGSIADNTTGNNGGGVHCASGSFSISGGEITGNKTTVQSGGGIFVNEGASATIKGTAKISGNISKESGGGIFTIGEVTMSAGQVSGNSTGASQNGGGVCVHSYTANKALFKLTGGTISGNSSTNGNGVAVMNRGAFSMGGDAAIPATDDVYLDTTNSRTISVDGTLSSTSTVATITPKAYSNGKAVLSGSALGSEYTKFEVTPKTGETWGISSEGKLVQSVSPGITISVPTYTNDVLDLTATGKTSDGSGYTFSAKTGYSSYLWTVNGAVYSTTANTVTIPKDGLPLTNILMLVATDAAGNVHEAKATFTVSE